MLYIPENLKTQYSVWVYRKKDVSKVFSFKNFENRPTLMSMYDYNSVLRLTEADGEVKEAYQRISAARVKKRTPTKKVRITIWVEKYI